MLSDKALTHHKPVSWPPALCPSGGGGLNQLWGYVGSKVPSESWAEWTSEAGGGPGAGFGQGRQDGLQSTRGGSGWRRGTTQDGRGLGETMDDKGDKWGHLTAFLYIYFFYFCLYISWQYCVLAAAHGIFNCSFCYCSATKSCLSLVTP